MVANSVKGKNVSNLAALGWEWKSADSGTRFQIVALRGVPGPPSFWSCTPDVGGTWASLGRMADEWTCDGTWKSFKAMVDRFVSAESA